MKKRMGWFVMAAILLALALVFLSRFLNPPFSVAEDEIALEIQLDVRGTSVCSSSTMPPVMLNAAAASPTRTNPR